MYLSVWSIMNIPVFYVDKLGYIFIVAFDDQYSIEKQKSSSSKFDISKNINSHGYKSPPVKLF